MTSDDEAIDSAPITGDLPVFGEVPPGPLPPGLSGEEGEEPARIAGYRLGVVPTTARQYWHYLTDRGLLQVPAPRLHSFPAAAGAGLRTTPEGGVVLDEECAELPVTYVTWHGAMAYCDWLGDRIGLPCRLPAAAEWWHAAAGAAGLRWALGNDFDRKTYAPAVAGPRPVGCTPANAFGLRDMTGNVFEWCADPLVADEAAHRPALGSRVIKGGAYTVRNPESFDNATVFTADELSTVPYIGFRVLCVNPVAVAVPS
jgi:formylglycine-generating enzyme required for sulfatase activity